MNKQNEIKQKHKVRKIKINCVVLGRVHGGGGYSGWVPYHGEEVATVKVYVGSPLPDLDGFCRPSLPEPEFPSLHCGSSPVDAVVGFLHMDSNAILQALSPYCLSVFT